MLDRGVIGGAAGIAGIVMSPPRAQRSSLSAAQFLHRGRLQLWWLHFQGIEIADKPRHTTNGNASAAGSNMSACGEPDCPPAVERPRAQLGCPR